MDRIAGIDLGTNSFLCLIADLNTDGSFSIVSDEVEVVRLGQDVNATKLFQPQALDRAKKTLRKFKESLDKHKPGKILAVATSAARDVGNSDELKKICSDLGIPLEIISGPQEAEMTFKGAISASRDQKIRAVIDIGGGSTEIIVGDATAIFQKSSIDIGAVRITEMFFNQHPPTQETVDKAKNYIQSKAAEVISKLDTSKIDEMLAVAGTPTELASSQVGGYDPKKIDNFVLSISDLESWISKLSTANIEERVRVLKISPGRADIIFAGVLILTEILKQFGRDHYKVSTRGLRYGVCLEASQR